MSDSATSLSLKASLAAWRSPLSRALHRNRSKPYSRYFQLATVHSDGRPANRTVVHRGFLPDTNALIFVTDQRSQKVQDNQSVSWAEVCWYFTETREQFRLAGRLLIIGRNYPETALTEARLTTWRNLSDATRQQFFWPHPGQPRGPESDFETKDIDPDQPPSTFCLGLINPDTVDHLELRGEPQNRTHYTRVDDQWQVSNLNP
jgi:pyridoxamine 5'-phosphate oxidase